MQYDGTFSFISASNLIFLRLKNVKFHNITIKGNTNFKQPLIGLNSGVAELTNLMIYNSTIQDVYAIYLGQSTNSILTNITFDSVFLVPSFHITVLIELEG